MASAGPTGPARTVGAPEGDAARSAALGAHRGDSRDGGIDSGAWRGCGEPAVRWDEGLHGPHAHGNERYQQGLQDSAASLDGAARGPVENDAFTGRSDAHVRDGSRNGDGRAHGGPSSKGGAAGSASYRSDADDGDSGTEGADAITREKRRRAVSKPQAEAEGAAGGGWHVAMDGGQDGGSDGHGSSAHGAADMCADDAISAHSGTQSESGTPSMGESVQDGEDMEGMEGVEGDSLYYGRYCEEDEWEESRVRSFGSVQVLLNELPTRRLRSQLALGVREVRQYDVIEETCVRMQLRRTDDYNINIVQASHLVGALKFILTSPLLPRLQRLLITGVKIPSATSARVFSRLCELVRDIFMNAQQLQSLDVRHYVADENLSFMHLIECASCADPDSAQTFVQDGDYCRTATVLDAVIGNSLQRLSIRTPRLKTTSLSTLVTALRSPASHLTILELDECLNAFIVFGIAAALWGNKILRKLVLIGALTRAGGDAPLRGQASSSLTAAGRDLRGISLLARVLPSSALGLLCLWNYDDPADLSEHTADFVAMLRDTRTLSHLELRELIFPPLGMAALCDAAAMHPALSTLWLCGAGVPDGHGPFETAFANMLATGPHLAEVGLSPVPPRRFEFSDSGIAAVIRAARTNRSLTYLSIDPSLDRTDVHDRDIVALIAARPELEPAFLDIPDVLVPSTYEWDQRLETDRTLSPCSAERLLIPLGVAVGLAWSEEQISAYRDHLPNPHIWSVVDIVRERPGFSERPLLHCAASLANGEAIRILAARGHRLDCRDQDGNTVLHAAAQRPFTDVGCREDVCRVLLSMLPPTQRTRGPVAR